MLLVIISIWLNLKSSYRLKRFCTLRKHCMKEKWYWLSVNAVEKCSHMELEWTSLKDMEDFIVLITLSDWGGFFSSQFETWDLFWWKTLIQIMEEVSKFNNNNINNNMRFEQKYLHYCVSKDVSLTWFKFFPQQNCTISALLYYCILPRISITLWGFIVSAFIVTQPM